MTSRAKKSLICSVLWFKYTSNEVSTLLKCCGGRCYQGTPFASRVIAVYTSVGSTLYGVIYIVCVCLHLGHVFSSVITATTLCPVATQYHMSLFILVRCACHYVLHFLETNRKHRNETGRNQGVYLGCSLVVRIGYSQ